VVTPLLLDSVRAFEHPDQILAETAQRLPMKRLGTTDDIAGATRFLLGGESSWITGSYFVIDGGFLAT
jgi:NAD(P)-dependent dehydrogenase (short-subunit alcohol dehydrogenase family)